MCRHRGSCFNFVESLTYARPGKVVRTDEEEAYAISGFLELHPPPDGGLVPWIEWVYVPELHQPILDLLQTDIERGSSGTR